MAGIRLMGMKIWTVVACVVVGVLGLLTVIFGVAGMASAAQSSATNNHRVTCEYDELGDEFCRVSCRYQASAAVGCGIVAMLLALTTQIVSSAATGCCGCFRSWGIPSEPKRIVALVLSTFSWVISITVVILFMVGAIVITGGDKPTDGNGKCVPPGTGEFAAATVLFIITVVFQIGSYILLEVTAVEGSKKQGAEESGIATGQPAAESLNNGEEKVAAAGGPHPSAPAASSEVNVDHPPPSAPAGSSEANGDPTAHSVSPKSGADPTSQV